MNETNPTWPTIAIYPHHSPDGIRQRRQVAEIIAAGNEYGSDIDIIATAILQDLLARPSHLTDEDGQDARAR